MKIYSSLLLTLLCIVACRQPEDPPTFSSLIVRNTWKVGYSRDNGNVFTNLYSTWKVTFKSDGTCMVNDGSNTLNGTWEENIPTRTVKLFINSSSLQASFISRE